MNPIAEASNTVNDKTSKSNSKKSMSKNGTSKNGMSNGIQHAKSIGANGDDGKNTKTNDSAESDSGCDEQFSMNYRTKKIAFVRKMKAMSLSCDSTGDLSDSSCSEPEKAGNNSDSGNSTQNSVSSTESVLSLHPDDIEFDQKCTNLLSKNLMKCSNGQSILAIKDFARAKLYESVNGHKVKVGVIGDIGCGKTSLIREIFGGGDIVFDKPTSNSVKSISYKYPNHNNITFTEIPSITSTRRVDREEYVDKMKLRGFDLILVLTDSHIREWSMWLGRQLRESEVPFFYVRTKIDKTTAEDAKKFPRTYCEEKVVQRIRERCREAMVTGKVGDGTKAFAVSTIKKDKWDFRALLQALGEELPRNKRRSLNLCLPPLTPHIINEKQKAHAQRIWMISALSVASGVMEIPGFAIAADVELLRAECHHYRKSLGISDDILSRLSREEDNPALEAAWDLIFYDDGIHSILRQASMEIDPEDLVKFAQKIPVLGGGISFPATCSTLRFILQELAGMALRYVSQDLDECESLEDINSLSDISSIASINSN